MEVTLREYQLTDLDDLFVWASDERASAWSMYNTCNNKDDVLVFMEKKVLTHPWMRAICLNDRPVGAISVIFFY
jgi:RimJ/RimL family protein N-acetyltransferase